jgi:hypothetical protein
VDGPTFTQAIEEALQPRLALSGDRSGLEKFTSFFQVGAGGFQSSGLRVKV